MYKHADHDYQSIDSKTLPDDIEYWLLSLNESIDSATKKTLESSQYLQDSLQKLRSDRTETLD